MDLPKLPSKLEMLRRAGRVPEPLQRYARTEIGITSLDPSLFWVKTRFEWQKTSRKWNRPLFQPILLWVPTLGFGQWERVVPENVLFPTAVNVHCHHPLQIVWERSGTAVVGHPNSSSKWERPKCGLSGHERMMSSGYILSFRSAFAPTPVMQFIYRALIARFFAEKHDRSCSKVE